MATEVWGCSDDLIEFRGDVDGECGGGDDETLLVFSDGTILGVKYGKGPRGIWNINTVRKGDLLDRIDECDDDGADRYSDTAHFNDGLKWAIECSNWNKVC